MRKILYSFFLFAGWMLIAIPILAQEKTVTGRVLNENNQPMPGVTVKVRGSDRSVQTDASGGFSISVKKGETLEFSHVGFEKTTVRVGDANTISIGLKSDETTMGEVVVTAMDIKRNPRELGYAAQKVGGKEIAESQRENFLNSLQGRVAGLTINPTSGAAGASSQIILRGFNSLTLNNQPLFVVDGVVLDNQTMNETSNGGTSLGLASDRPNRNNDYTNRIADLNPNDIESITVLKGPEATALYGSQAASGAIIITTKKAITGKFSVNYDNSFRIQEITRYMETVDDFQTGANGVASSNNFSYWGPRYPDGTAKNNNIDNFFRTGFSQTHNLAADFGYKEIGFRFSGSFFDQKGVVPTNDFRRYNVRLANTTKIGKFAEFTPSVQYIRSINDKALRSAGGFLLGLYVWPRENDIRNFEGPNGEKLTVFASNPYLETDNPLYNVHRNHSQDITNRYIISGGVNIYPLSWLTIAGRFGYDKYDVTGYTFYHPLSSLTSTSQNGGLGALDNYWRNYTGYNHTINATAKKTIGKFSGRLMVGTMWQDYKTEMFAVYGTNLVDSFSLIDNKMYKNGQVVTDQNFNQVVGSPKDSSITRANTRRRLLRNNQGLFNYSQIRQIAYFGEVGLSFNNYLFLNYTHRFEEASVFPKDFRKYNYPGFSVSAILTDMVPSIKGKILTYWKLRMSRAGTAKLFDPYKNQSVFVNNFASSNVGLIYSYGFDNNNPFIKPEKQRTYEMGTEFRLFNSNLGFDVTYYNTLNTDLIMQQFRQSYGTGFILNTTNAGSVRNQGIEVVFDINIMRQKDLSWTMRVNFYRGWSKVLKLPTAIQAEMYIADTWLYGNARGGLKLNGPTTTITSFGYQRNNKGDILINPANGLPLIRGTFDVVGDRQPDFTSGIQNNLRYKNWSLNFLWDLKAGGDVYNGTELYLTIQGKSKRTADRETPKVVKGVLNDGLQNSATPTPNTIAIMPYYLQTYYTSLPEEEFVQHDVNFFKMREITLSYSLPQNKLSKLKYFKSLSFFATGNDLILITNYRGADPSINGNTAAGNGVGAFGFDYGTLPAPISINFGLRAGF
jgi:TonB-linked SusC/RagA family outer membrane protein